MLKAVQCKAHARSGAQCGKPAEPGARVCRFHGGRAPQVLAAARRRLLMAADPATARLIEIALSKRTKDCDAIVAIREVLNRSGLTAEPASGAGTETGQVLWDEFCAIYRRRVALAVHERGEPQEEPFHE
jgi:hypothetical protein